MSLKSTPKIERSQGTKKHNADKYARLIPGGGDVFFDMWEEK